jgi:hypothetical protein
VQVFDDLRAHRGLAHMGDGVSGHKCTPFQSKPIAGSTGTDCQGS